MRIFLNFLNFFISLPKENNFFLSSIKICSVLQIFKMFIIHLKFTVFKIIDYMSKEDQVVEEKVLTFKTINNTHLDQVANFIVSQYSQIEAVS